MSDDSLARSQSAAPLSVDTDYDAIHATIVATETGRWFLDEYARRYRGADTELVLAAIERIEQAIRGVSATEPRDSVQADLAAMVEAISQTRGEVVVRHGDPAASGEAAVAEFRNAVEQIQELVWAAHGGDAASDLGAQIAFQANRLAGAGDRLERSMGGLRTLLGLLDDLDQRLRQLADVPAADVAAEPSPSAAAPLAEAPLVVWSLPSADAAAEASPAPSPARADPLLVGANLDEPRPPPDAAPAEPLWDLTVAPEEPVREQVAAVADLVSEASVTDWAFADTAPVAAPQAAQPMPAIESAPAPQPPPADLPISALERLEAREYGRRHVADVVAPPPDPGEAPWRSAVADAPLPPVDVAERPHAGGFDDLVLGGMPERAHEPAPAFEPDTPSVEWTIEPAAALPAAEPIFDADLFDGDDKGPATPSNLDAPAPQSLAHSLTDDEIVPPDRAPEPAAAETASFRHEGPIDRGLDRPSAIGPRTKTVRDLIQDLEAPLPAMRALPDPAPEPDAAEPQAPPEESRADVPSVLQRLESMRTAIAALMDEVSEKTAGRNSPPRS